MTLSRYISQLLINIITIICIVITADIASADALYICSKKDAIKAEELSAKAVTWDQLHKLYKRYHQCDDGAIAEGFSESVTVILSQSWSQINKLQLLTKKDPGFEIFVLNHLDETVPEERLQLIDNFASNRCPDSAKSLCGKIFTKLRQL